MKPKQQIIEIVNQYVNQKEKLSQQLQDIRLDTRYNPEYRKKLEDDKCSELDACSQKAYKAINQVVLTVKSVLSRQKKDFEKQAATIEYQLALSNTLQMLSMGASRLEVEAIRQALQPFALDGIAAAAFHVALVNGGHTNEETNYILKPVFRGNDQEEKLDKFMDNVKATCGMNPVYGMELGAASIDFTLSFWNDDMTGRL